MLPRNKDIFQISAVCTGVYVHIWTLCLCQFFCLYCFFFEGSKFNTVKYQGKDFNIASVAVLQLHWNCKTVVFLSNSIAT